ncbi:MAG: hypothetical protein R3Y45_03730 [Bacillota bacterium]
MKKIFIIATIVVVIISIILLINFWGKENSDPAEFFQGEDGGYYVVVEATVKGGSVQLEEVDMKIDKENSQIIADGVAYDADGTLAYIDKNYYKLVSSSSEIFTHVGYLMYNASYAGYLEADYTIMPVFLNDDGIYFYYFDGKYMMYDYFCEGVLANSSAVPTIT